MFNIDKSLLLPEYIGFPPLSHFSWFQSHQETMRWHVEEFFIAHLKGKKKDSSYGTERVLEPVAVSALLLQACLL